MTTTIDTPHLQPCMDDLLSALGSMEQKLARAENRPIRDEIIFPFAELQAGHGMGPTATFLDPENLRIRLDF